MTRRGAERGFLSLFLRYWLPVLAYITAIVTVSAQPYLRGPIEFTNSDKIYHVLEYSILGLLLARAMRGSAPGWPPMAVALSAIACGILVGTSDEFFQSFVPGRISSAFDLLADTVGVALAQVVYRALVKD